LVWTQADGAIVREETLHVAPLSQPSDLEKAWVAAAAAPLPIVWGVGAATVVPAVLIQNNEADSYSEALSRFLPWAWPHLCIVFFVSLACAWWTRRLQHKYYRSGTAAWCTFVFLFGPPGFVAYRLLHVRPKREECPQCHVVVPRDREACAACDTMFPPPRRLGTEIFA
jgi:hypothetical protein